MTPAKSEKSWLRGEIKDHCKEERQKLASISVSIRIKKARFKLCQGKQMVEIRGKLNDEKAAHRLSTENMDLAIRGMRTQNGQTSTGCDLSITEWLGLEGVLRTIQFPMPSHLVLSLYVLVISPSPSPSPRRADPH